MTARQPTTDCEDCAWAEMTSRERVRTAIRRTFFPPTPLEVEAARLRAWAATTNALMGRGPVGWYERHRDRWVEAGDRMELDRMKRHVTKEIR